jgi:hypothetical protein
MHLHPAGEMVTISHRSVETGAMTRPKALGACKAYRHEKNGIYKMSYQFMVILLGVIAAFCVTLWGLFTRRKSAAFGVTAALFAFTTGLGAWYSWAEPPQSVAWTTGYGLACLLGCATANRHLRRKASRKR